MEQGIQNTIEPRKEKERIDTTSSNLSVDGHIDANTAALSGFFKIQDPDVEQGNQLRYITNFFTSHGIHEMAEMMLNIRSIENRLGAIPLHMSTLDAIYNYIKTQSHIEALTQQKKGMESNV